MKDWQLSNGKGCFEPHYLSTMHRLNGLTSGDIEVGIKRKERETIDLCGSKRPGLDPRVGECANLAF